MDPNQAIPVAATVAASSTTVPNTSSSSTPNLFPADPLAQPVLLDMQPASSASSSIPHVPQQPLPAPPAGAPPANAANAAAANNANNAQSGISIWDFLLFGQSQELQSYINMLQERDDASTDDKEILTQKILDSRVEQSVRFKFNNPVIGQHGYTHVLSAKSPSKFAKDVVLKGTTPLHFAVHLRMADCVQILIHAGADQSLVDEKNQTPYKLAREIKDDKIAGIFQQYRSHPHRIRKDLRKITHEVDVSRKHLAQYQHDTRVLTQVRQTLMAQVVALWWRYTTSIVRRHNVEQKKQNLATQLENLVQVYSQTAKTLENEKATLTNERNALKDQVASLEATVAEQKQQLADLGSELAERNTLRSEINKLQQALSTSLSLMPAIKTASVGAGTSAEDTARIQTLSSQLSVAQTENATLKVQLHAAMERSVLNEQQLRSELDLLNKQNSELKHQISMLRAASATSAVTTKDVLEHPEYVRVAGLLDRTQQEVARLRLVESQLREQLASAHGVTAHGDASLFPATAANIAAATSSASSLSPSTLAASVFSSAVPSSQVSFSHVPAPSSMTSSTPSSNNPAL